jgi:hypothetical protein
MYVFRSSVDYDGEDEGGIIDISSTGSSDRHRDGLDGDRIRHGGNRNTGDVTSGKSDDKGMIQYGLGLISTDAFEIALSLSHLWFTPSPLMKYEGDRLYLHLFAGKREI